MYEGLMAGPTPNEVAPTTTHRLVVPTRPGLYESLQFPVSEGYNAYQVQKDGALVEVTRTSDSWSGHLGEVAHPEAEGPFRHLKKGEWP